jgi:hypothetical protein
MKKPWTYLSAQIDQRHQASNFLNIYCQLGKPYKHFCLFKFDSIKQFFNLNLYYTETFSMYLHTKWGNHLVCKYIHGYISLTLYLQKGIAGKNELSLSQIFLWDHVLPKLLSWKILQTKPMVSHRYLIIIIISLLMPPLLAFLMDYTWGKRVIIHHSGPVWVGGC